MDKYFTISNLVAAKRIAAAKRGGTLPDGISVQVFFTVVTVRVTTFRAWNWLKGQFPQRRIVA